MKDHIYAARSRARDWHVNLHRGSGGLIADFYFSAEQRDRRRLPAASIRVLASILRRLPSPFNLPGFSPSSAFWAIPRSPDACGLGRVLCRTSVRFWPRHLKTSRQSLAKNDAESMSSRRSTPAGKSFSLSMTLRRRSGAPGASGYSCESPSNSANAFNLAEPPAGSFPFQPAENSSSLKVRSLRATRQGSARRDAE